MVQHHNMQLSKIRTSRVVQDGVACIKPPMQRPAGAFPQAFDLRSKRLDFTKIGETSKLRGLWKSRSGGDVDIMQKVGVAYPGNEKSKAEGSAKGTYAAENTPAIPLESGV